MVALTCRVEQGRFHGCVVVLGVALPFSEGIQGCGGELPDFTSCLCISGLSVSEGWSDSRLPAASSRGPGWGLAWPSS